MAVRKTALSAGFLKICPRGLRVLPDLRGELLEAVELLFRAQEGVELHARLPPVEVARVVEQVALDAECYPFSDLKDPDAADSSWRRVDMDAWEDNLYKIDNTLALGIMPYGLAANLLVDENPTAAGYFQQRYDELLRGKKSRTPADVGEIENLYGGIEYGQFSRW